MKRNGFFARDTSALYNLLKANEVVPLNVASENLYSHWLQSMIVDKKVWKKLIVFCTNLRLSVRGRHSMGHELKMKGW